MLAKLFRRENLMSLLLISLGLLAPLGYILNFRPLRGLGLAYMVSPLPLVFSDVDGYEAFGAEFTLKIYTSENEYVEKVISNKEGVKIQGPYNRRNVYGAVIGYAPRIPSPLFDSVMKHGFCRDDILVKEFDLPSGIKKVQLSVKDNTIGRENKVYIFEVICST